MLNGKMRRAAVLLALLPLVAASAAPPLRVGTSGDYPPFSIREADGSPSGFDIDVAEQLASSLGRRVDFVPFRWPELSEKAKSGSFDFVASGVTIRPERVLLGRFTRPYAISEAVVLVRAEDAERFRNVADLEKAKARIAVNHGGYLESVARATFREAEVVPVDDNRKLGDEVVEGRAAALVTDSIEAAHLPPLTRIASLTRDRKAVFVPAQIPDGGDAKALHASLDSWMAAHNPALQALRAKWLPPSSGLDEANAHVEAIAALVDQRSGIAPWIATAKRPAGLPIEDPEREKKVLAGAREKARGVGLNEDRVAALFAVLIEVSKDIQRAAPPIESPITLDILRGILGDLDQRLVGELAAGPALDESAFTADVEAMTWPGVGAARKQELARALAGATQR